MIYGNTELNLVIHSVRYANPTHKIQIAIMPIIKNGWSIEKAYIYFKFSIMLDNPFNQRCYSDYCTCKATDH